METRLNISHLGRRLGSGVKFEKGIDDVTHSELLAVRDDYSILLSGYVYKTQNSECEFQRPAMWVQMCLKKPILRTDLTKPITHDGKTFVPIEKLVEIFDYIEFSDNFFDNFWLNDIGSIPYEMVTTLISWNFHIDEPEGSYIKAEELPVNPYEV